MPKCPKFTSSFNIIKLIIFLQNQPHQKNDVRLGFLQRPLEIMVTPAKSAEFVNHMKKTLYYYSENDLGICKINFFFFFGGGGS